MRVTVSRQRLPFAFYLQLQNEPTPPPSPSSLFPSRPKTKPKQPPSHNHSAPHHTSQTESRIPTTGTRTRSPSDFARCSLARLTRCRRSRCDSRTRRGRRWRYLCAGSPRRGHWRRCMCAGDWRGNTSTSFHAAGTNAEAHAHATAELLREG